jgi:hypothetical protein
MLPFRPENYSWVCGRTFERAHSKPQAGIRVRVHDLVGLLANLDTITLDTFAFERAAGGLSLSRIETHPVDIGGSLSLTMV